jgi:uncharacterized protein YyaL (SSP411 family)
MRPQEAICPEETVLPLIMKFQTLLVQARVFQALCGLVLLSSSCRKEKPVEARSGNFPLVVAPELLSNGIGLLPGALYQNQVSSPIHWQPWTKDTMNRARESRRLVFCVIAMPQQPGFQTVLDSLTRDSSCVAAINDHYVPVLVDGDSSREIGLLTADLCAEIKRPLNPPLFMWMTHEGNPVAWIPVSQAQAGSVVDLFNQSHTMVSQMWQDSWDYVLKNSALDNANRRTRFAARKISRVTSNQPATDVVRSLRQLASLYDPYSRSFDETGGLFPSSSLGLLATASVHPGLPADVRSHCMNTTRELLKDLLPSAMFDPLDGGVFQSRKGTTWALPSFTRDCPTQARVAETLFEAYRATGDTRAMEAALGLITFAEKNYLTPEGLFSIGMSKPTDSEKWMWSVEEIQNILPPADASWWIKATGMKGLGNLPSESDPRREFFRCNTLGLAKPMAEIAAEEGLSSEVFKPRFEEAKAKLLAAREARIGKLTTDANSHAGASLRMVCAYASAFAVTGDVTYRDKSVELLKKSREVFAGGARLRMFSRDAPDSISAGRAFIYALALQAALDVAAITSDEQWLVWSEDLATSAAELFTTKDFLKECPDEAKIIDLPVTDLVMLFDDSTAGLVSMAECRLAGIGRPLVESFSELATPMPTYVLERPVLHTDLLLATLARHYNLTVVMGERLAPELKLAVERLPIRMIQHRAAKPVDEVPAGAVKVLSGGGPPQVVTNAEALRAALQISADK